MTRILIIEDDLAIANSLRQVLVGEAYKVELVSDGREGLARIQASPFDVVLTDLKLPGLSGLDLVRELHRTHPHLPLILMTAYGTSETAIEAMKCGAFDYIVKPFEMIALLELLEKAAALSPSMSPPLELGTRGLGHNAIVGHSPAMQNVFKQIGLLAPRPVTVLIRGETGTGKELVARAICQHSDRVHHPFIAVNCAAIPQPLIESELFGHERGAFTGAVNQRIGRFEQAHQGTIFLDEIGDLSLEAQTKLLRVLQEKEIQRLGGKNAIPLDIRLIAATHRDLESAIRDRTFREDLYYRLNIATIYLPPLRERTRDIPELVIHFLPIHAHEMEFKNISIGPDAVQFLQEQPWPGNVRQLSNVVGRALLLAPGRPITLEACRQALTGPMPPPAQAGLPLAEIISRSLADARLGQTQGIYTSLLQTLEYELLSQAIRLAKGNQVKAARWLGISRPTLREKLNFYGLHPHNE